MNRSIQREIEADCSALSYAFAYHLDQKNYAALASLFAQDGCFVRMGVRLGGPEKILEHLSERPADQFTRHITTNFHFTHVGEDRANAVVYNVSYFSFPESRLPLEYLPQQVMLLDFVDTYTRTALGWRFLERDARALLIPEEVKSRLPPAAFSRGQN